MATPEVSEVDVTSLLDEEKANSKLVVCAKCSSKILTPGKGFYEELEPFELHVMHKKLEEAGLEKEMIKQFYRVDDMFDFENLGFSNTVGNIKYLICADCEIGPIGWHSLDTKKSYVALSRVKHQ